MLFGLLRIRHNIYTYIYTDTHIWASFIILNIIFLQKQNGKIGEDIWKIYTYIYTHINTSETILKSNNACRNKSGQVNREYE